MLTRQERVMDRDTVTAVRYRRVEFWPQIRMARRSLLMIPSRRVKLCNIV